MEYNEEDFLMLSGIQHYKFCKRQWALIHIEQQWAENTRTVQGELLHDKAHDTTNTEKRGDLIISRAMPIHSRALGASGECDIVEFHKDSNGVNINTQQGKFKIYPVEYKRGSPKKSEEDIFQLVAQVICLEEMFCCEIEKGYLYYGETKHRLTVEVTDELKSEVKKSFDEMHALFERKYTPKVKKSKACNSCSMKDICLPILCKDRSAAEYINNMIAKGDD
ncbi:MAG: CRISPR-associated protein Cas4 [Oscillospiraceae bacterium]